MKIAFTSDNLTGWHKNWSGAEQACLRIGRLLIKDGQGVSFLTLNPELDPKENLEVIGVDVMNGGFFQKKIKSILRHFFPFDPSAFSSSQRILKRIRPDILHLQRFNELSLAIISSAKKLKIPVVFSLYDFWALCPKGTLMTSQNLECRSFQGKNCANCFKLTRSNLLIKAGSRIGFSLRKKIFSHYLKKIDAFIVLSSSWKEILKKNGVKEEKISVIPLPLFEKIEETEGAINKNSILFLGWIYPHKGLHVLIEALNIVSKTIPDIQLYVIESGINQEYKTKILENIEEYKLGRNIHFLGKLPNEKVQELLLKTEMVAVPEQWGIAWPIFLTEAMAKGKPIVASRIGDIPQFIKDGENGFLADPRDPADFARKIIMILKNEKYSELGRRAQEDIIKICDANNIISKLKDLYDSLLTKKEKIKI